MVQTRSITNALSKLGISTVFHSIDLNPPRRSRKTITVMVRGGQVVMQSNLDMLKAVFVNFFHRFRGVVFSLPSILGVIGGVRAIFEFYKLYFDSPEMLEVVVLRKSNL